MSSVKVSVIVPVYRVETEYLKECILSIMHQSLKEIEIILVDDGAPKESGAVLDYYAGLDSRIRVIHQSNQGVCVARNAGLAICTGKYVTFVDSDDYIDEKNLEKAYVRAEEDELEVLLWGSYKVYPERKEIYSPYLAEIRIFNEKQKEQLELKTMAGDLPVYVYPCSKWGSGSCCSKLYLVSFLRANRLSYPPGIKRAEDVNFNIRVFEAAERIGYMHEFFYYYRQLHESATYVYRENGIKVFTDALNGLAQFLKANKKSDYFYQVYYMRCMFFFLESMDMDYLNPDNPASFFKRMSAMRAAMKSEPYREAFVKLDSKNLTFAKKIPLILIRMKSPALLALFYTVYRKLLAGRL